MIDPMVERQYADCRELLDFWTTFHEFFTMAVKGGQITHESEGQFLEVKSRIAMLHDSFMDALKEDQNIGQNVLKIIESAITLKHLTKMGQAEISKMEIEWHDAYLLLTSTIGTLEERRNELATMSAAQVRAQKAAGAASQNVRNFFTSTAFKLAVGVAAFLFCTVGVQVLGIFDWNSLGTIPALQAPYRAGKALLRSFNPDSPWPSVAAMSRKDFAQAQKLYEAPKIINDTPDAILAKTPAPVAEKLRAKLEYVHEELKSKFREGIGQYTVHIHSFRLATADDARAAKQAWNDYLMKNPTTSKQLQCVHTDDTVNIVVLLECDNPDYLNDIFVNIYGG